jgi:hypothetical protein
MNKNKGPPSQLGNVKHVPSLQSLDFGNKFKTIGENEEIDQKLVESIKAGTIRFTNSLLSDLSPDHLP